MKHNIVKVLKKTGTAVKGSVTLPTSYGTVSAGQVGVVAPAASVPQEARVIESNSEYAIIEVTCSCGNKMHIQCNYGGLTKQ